MGFIKNLFGGIFSFLAGIFKIFKKSEYYLEASEAASGIETPAPAETAPTKKEKAKKAKAASEDAVDESMNGKVADPATAVAAAAPVTPAPSPAAPQPTQAAPVLFAPNYLVNAGSATSRRRPGPSLTRFKNMAKQVKS
jgi:hypothetical protein